MYHTRGTLSFRHHFLPISHSHFKPLFQLLVTAGHATNPRAEIGSFVGQRKLIIGRIDVDDNVSCHGRESYCLRLKQRGLVTNAQQRIHDAALRLFAERGVTEINVKELAEGPASLEAPSTTTWAIRKVFSSGSPGGWPMK
jgi:hypothetical protein